VPFEVGENIEPGTTNKSLLNSPALPAVSNVPESSSASIINVA
jgi:hypothetical protein